MNKVVIATGASSITVEDAEASASDLAELAYRLWADTRDPQNAPGRLVGFTTSAPRESPA